LVRPKSGRQSAQALLHWNHMRHLVWLAGCLLVLSCTVNNDNLNDGTGGGTGGAGGCPRCVGTGGAPATGGQTGAGGAIATGGQPGTGGQAGSGQNGTGGSASGGQGGGGKGGGTGGSGTGGSGTGGGQGGQAGGESCDAIASDYGKALTTAKRCIPGATGQCAHLVDTSLSCSGCKQYVNDTTTLAALQTAWTNQACGSVAHPCPAIACVIPTQSTCAGTSSTSGGPNAGADPSGTCTGVVLTPTN
jgi:hypothetical protein